MSLQSHPSNRGNEHDDDYDELYDYDIDAAIPELNLDVNKLTTSNAKAASKGKDKDDLGVDEDIKVRKKRVIVKLDAERLLSQQGLPRLKRAPQELTPKLKGKGHEYKDAARILNYYQLWADDLFRKGNFRDTLGIIEKLGHTKRVQVARHELVDSFYKTEEPPAENNSDAEKPSGQASGSERQIQGDAAPEEEETNDGALFLGGDESDSDLEMGNVGEGRIASRENDGIPDDDELDALIRMEAEHTAIAASHSKENTPSVFGGGSEPLSRITTSILGGSAHIRETARPVTPDNIEEFPDEFDDDFDMDDWDAVEEARTDLAGASTTGSHSPCPETAKPGS